MSTSKHIISKIEGHGSITISLKDKTARLNVQEGERFFEELLVGKSYEDAPFIVSRICGVCPTAHTMVSIKAVEDAFGITPPKKAIILRMISLSAQIIQSHALHLFFLVMPDLLKTHSALDIAVSDPEVFSAGLELKAFGDDILNCITGRSIHPLTPVVGGFTREPNLSELIEVSSRIPGLLAKAEDAVKLIDRYSSELPSNTRKARYFALSASRSKASQKSLAMHQRSELVTAATGPRSGKGQTTKPATKPAVMFSGYPLYGGEISGNDGSAFSSFDYDQNFIESSPSYTTAKVSKFKGESFMVGALPRLLLAHENLNPVASALLRQSAPLSKLEFDSFLNNTAQAIEIVHFLEEIQVLLELYKASGASKVWNKYDIKKGTGAAAIEAPRGLLFNKYEIDNKGKIIRADIMTPTVQNLRNLEKDVEHLLIAHPTINEKNRTREIEMLIRAYDPCLTCSVH